MTRRISSINNMESVHPFGSLRIFKASKFQFLFFFRKPDRKPLRSFGHRLRKYGVTCPKIHRPAICKISNSKIRKALKSFKKTLSKPKFQQNDFHSPKICTLLKKWWYSVWRCLETLILLFFWLSSNPRVSNHRTSSRMMKGCTNHRNKTQMYLGATILTWARARIIGCDIPLVLYT